MSISEPLKEYLVDYPLPFQEQQRSSSLENTLARVVPLRDIAGITRLSDITNLDCVGVPVYLAVRPAVDMPAVNVTVYHGTGLNRLGAKVSALMEALERYSSERHGRPAIVASLAEIKNRGKAVDPRDLILPEGVSYRDDELLEWVCGRDLFTGEVYFVPAISVFFPYQPAGGARFFKGFVNTTGLASGNSLVEAIASGLAEVIERDAEVIAEFSRSAISLDLSTIESPSIKSLIELFEKAQINLVVKEITSNVGIPSFFAVTDDPHTENPLLLCRGLGTHVNPEIAIVRAIREVAQSRCAIICGAREDLIQEEDKRPFAYKDLKENMSYWYEAKPPFKNFKEYPIPAKGSVSQDIETMLEGLKGQYSKQAIIVNLTRPELGIPVVRVIVPGLEQPSSGILRMGNRSAVSLQNFSLS